MVASNEQLGGRSNNVKPELELVLRDVLIPHFLSEVRASRAGWYSPQFGSGERCSFDQLESLRDVADSWKEAVEDSLEFMCLRLARMEVQNAEGARWIPIAAHLQAAFDRNLALFSSCWRLAYVPGLPPITMQPVGTVTDAQLIALSDAVHNFLSVHVPTNIGTRTTPTCNLWVPPALRRW